MESANPQPKTTESLEQRISEALASTGLPVSKDARPMEAEVLVHLILRAVEQDVRRLLSSFIRSHESTSPGIVERGGGIVCTNGASNYNPQWRWMMVTYNNSGEFMGQVSFGTGSHGLAACRAARDKFNKENGAEAWSACANAGAQT